MKNILTAKEYFDGIKNKDRTILSKAITLIESTNLDHQIIARELLEMILPLTGKAKRIGVSGTPGVGKSTFLENFGLFNIQKNQTIAVLAIDPTSQKTGGSILGDKTRMEKLSSHKDAFIRPSPNGPTLGGIAAKTREVMLLCDAFGFDTIFIETVGVGQSEVSLSNIVDFFILLMQPGGGDDLQGIKRGILEVSHLVVVNKADGELVQSANIAAHDYERSLAILQGDNTWKSEVVLCSSIEKKGFDKIDEKINSFYENFFEEKMRLTKTQLWVQELLISRFENELLNNKKVQSEIQKIVNQPNDLLKNIDNIFEKIVNKL